MSGRLFNQIISVAAVAALTVIVSGCGQDFSTAPTSTNEFSGRVLSLPAPERLPAGIQLAKMPSVTVPVSASQGGVVHLGRFQLDFPPDALPQDAEITMRLNSPNSMVIELTPHGLQFQAPVHFTANIDGALSGSATRAGVAWLNPSTGNWEPISEGPIQGSTVSAELWHFSDYEFFQH